jgi:4-amino-4-deoxy-L-arabinose transferase-like glycosyltransferase
VALADPLILALIVAVAAVTRLTYLDLAEFKDDESRVAGIAVAFLKGQLLPLIGIPSSVGVNNPPAFVYLMAIPLAISRDPAIATGFIGLLGVGAVLLCYRFCDEHFDRRTAQVASLLFASAPWAIIFSRKMQAQDVVPFFGMLWIGSIFQLVRGRGRAHVLGVGLWLSVLIQLHLASLALIPLTALALAFYWWRVERWQVPWRWVGGALALVVVLWLPFLVFQLTHGLADLHAVLRVLRQPAEVSFDDFQTVIDMASLNAFVGLTGNGAPRYVSETINFDGLYGVERILLLASVGFVVARLLWSRGRAAGDWRYVFLLLWLVTPPLFFVHHSSPLYPHYFLTVFPAQFIAMGLLVSFGARWLAQRLPPAVPVAACVALVGTLVGSQVYGLITMLDFVGRESTLGAHGVPLRERELAIDRVVASAASSAKPAYVASSGQDYPSAFEYLATDRVPLKVFDDRDTFVTPADDGTPTTYLTSDPNQPAAKLLREHFGRYFASTVPYPGMKEGFDLYRLPPDAGGQLLQQAELQPLDRTLANGMHLIGYELDPSGTAGQPVHLGIYWQVLALPPPGEDYSFFTHLVDDQGKTWGHDDDLGYPPTFWRLGDLVVTWFTLDTTAQLPTGRGWIEAGVYRRSDVGRLPLRAPDGASADRLLLGPLKLIPANPAAVPSPQHQQVVSFGDQIDLLGYDLAGDVKPGGRLQVSLTWQARRTPSADYTTFVHVVTPDGKLMAQSDGQPGSYPTTLWLPNERTRDERSVPLPADLPSGSYQVQVGLYRADTLARLPTGAVDYATLSESVSTK